MTPAGSSDVHGLALMDDKESTSLRLRLRQILRTPIRAVQPEVPVKIRGRVRLRGAALAAPVTGTPCALYCLDAADTAVSLHLDGGELPASPLPREIRGLDLLLDDGTGCALVRIDGAQLSLLGNWMTSLATTQAQFLTARGRPPPRPPADPGQGRYLEYREMKIVPGELVTLFGPAVYEANPEPARSTGPGYRAPQHRCVFAATSASPLYIIQERVVALDAVG
jgi:hypothetical protein